VVREVARRTAPRDPDATIVGDSPSGTQFSFNAPGPSPYLKVSSNVMASNVISSPAPGYPMLARIAHVRGQVVLQALIARDGSVSTTHVLSGNRLLRGAAEEAVRRWRYRPFRVNGHSVGVDTTVTVDFHHADKAPD
jgi:protein TonB